MSTRHQTGAAETEEFDTYWTHGWKKCKKQPLVPLGESFLPISIFSLLLSHDISALAGTVLWRVGALATCIALAGATGALRSGNRAQLNKYLRYRVAAQGVTVVAAVAGTLMLTSKADDLKESQRRTALGQLPPSVDLVPSKHTSDSELPAPSIQTSSIATTTPHATSVDEAITMTGKGRFARPMRVSQALEETEKLPGAHRAPIKVSEFARRLERAEVLEGEAEKARAGKV
ncbi:hypothetical protein QFC21_007059 [Naganishia friedmannii]|uniref:Uncharacterized protein n=1 Tax=Naganishia friedmannii TaxID=89922 RepID=A0ACC2UZ12_9TREE|nr:hypothetical protein QFC21_007059 [Naganishia friedmannii]